MVELFIFLGKYWENKKFRSNRSSSFFNKFIISNFYVRIKVKVNSQKHLYSG